MQLHLLKVLLDEQQAHGVVRRLFLLDLAHLTLDLSHPDVEPAQVREVRERHGVHLGLAHVPRATLELVRSYPRRLAALRNLPRRFPPGEPGYVVQTADEPVPLIIFPVLQKGFRVSARSVKQEGAGKEASLGLGDMTGGVATSDREEKRRGSYLNRSHKERERGLDEASCR